MSETTTSLDPRRYFERVAPGRAAKAVAPPVCLYLEVTNRCNLLCETCPRTFEALEPPADMSWELFTRIVRDVRLFTQYQARVGAERPVVSLWLTGSARTAT